MDGTGKILSLITVAGCNGLVLSRKIKIAYASLGASALLHDFGTFVVSKEISVRAFLYFRIGCFQ